MGKIIRRHRGVVLVIVLTALFGLSLLGAALLLLAATERTVSANYLDQVRAGRVARSGLAAAVAAIQADPFNPDLRYWGNDEDEDGGRSSGESAEDAAHVHDVPLAQAKNPSLAVERDGNPGSGSSETRKYMLVDEEGRTSSFGVSGFHSGSTYGLESDVYQLKITDASACLHLNDGVHQFGGNRSSVSQNLGRMLNILGNLPTVRVTRLGDRMLAGRPAGGFRSLSQVERLFTRQEMLRFRPFVAIHNWVDKNVANPVPLSEHAAAFYPVRYYRGEPALYRRGRGQSQGGAGGPLRWFESAAGDRSHCAVYAMDEVNPSYIEIVHRAPINVNAARREVLITVLSDLQGFFIGERRAFAPYVPSPVTGSEGTSWIRQQYYSWWTVRHTYDADGTDGDEFGFIYPTQAIASVATGRTMAAMSAATLADHIIACRERRAFGPVNYRGSWFGGPFRSWMQFNRFVDNLVETGVIHDSRPIFLDYKTDAWETLASRECEGAKRFAAYAIADVIKANFNPNLHLNELNPDANLYQRVDKTDLIVNSTEFSFMPTGVFEIESIGRVLKPATGIRKQAAALFTLEAQRRVTASVRAFETYRETSQRHFAPGLFYPKREEAPPTNSGRALEIGPEPGVDAGVDADGFRNYRTVGRFEEDGYRGGWNAGAPMRTGWGYEFDGYIGLSTYGGPDPKAPKEQPCRPHWPVSDASDREGLHIHFNKGFDAAFNRGQPLEEQAAGAPPESLGQCKNLADRPGDPAGPLWTGNGEAGAHRIARSFRIPLEGRGPPPPLFPFAPGDLRVDGFYSERNAGAAYVMKQASESTSLDQANFALHGGVLSLWVKPGFFPEHTGKARHIVSMSKHHEVIGYRNPAPFNLMFLAGHDREANQDPEADELGTWVRHPDPPGGPAAPECDYRDPIPPDEHLSNIPSASRKVPTEQREFARGVMQFRPASLMAVRAVTSADAGSSSEALPDSDRHWSGKRVDIFDVENYAVTSCLNHNLHPHGLDTGSVPRPGADREALRPNYLEAHRWTHVMLSWQILPPRDGVSPSQDHALVIWVNGRPAEYLRDPRELQLFSEHLFGTRQAGIVLRPPMPRWDRHYRGGDNTIRLGEVSDLGWGSFPRNQSADMTLDEFHLWRVRTPFRVLSEEELELPQAAMIQDEVIELRKVAVRQWAAGRYYRPDGDAVFMSAPISVVTKRGRLADPTRLQEPPSVDSPAPKKSTTVRLEDGPSRVRLLGYAWTWVPEEQSRLDGKPLTLDYRPEKGGEYGSNPAYATADDKVQAPGRAAYAGAKDLDLAPSRSSFKWNDDLEKLGPFVLKPDLPVCWVTVRIVSPQGSVRRTIGSGAGLEGWEGGFRAPQSDFGPVELREDDCLRYDVQFHLEGLKPDSILLGSPFFDDVTFYLGLDEAEFLSFSTADVENPTR